MKQKIELSVQDDIFVDFPELRVFGLRAHIPEQQRLNAILEQERSDLERYIAPLRATESIAELPEVSCWREAYRKLGVKPSKYQSSVESLLRRVRNNGFPDTGIPVVDLYNLVSIKHRTPFGAYDASRLAPDIPIVLRRASIDRDKFLPIHGDPQEFPLTLNLAVYAQKSNVLCWGFNTRDSVTSCVHQSSSEIIFFSEAIDSEGIQRTRDAIQRMKSTLCAVGCIVGQSVTISSDEPVAEL